MDSPSPLNTLLFNLNMQSEAVRAPELCSATPHCMAGTRGKTTTCWLIRGILEAVPQLTGMVGSIEYALAHDKLSEEGDLWVPDEEDPTLKR